MQALVEAGWRMSRPHPRYSAAYALAKVEGLLSLPRIQNGLRAEIVEAFKAANVEINDAAGVIGEIMLDKEQSATDRLRATDMFIRMTHGYAPTTAISARLHRHQHERGDRNFDPEKMAQPPAMELDG
jgi:hypothetical protein